MTEIITILSLGLLKLKGSNKRKTHDSVIGKT